MIKAARERVSMDYGEGGGGRSVRLDAARDQRRNTQRGASDEDWSGDSVIVKTSPRVVNDVYNTRWPRNEVRKLGPRKYFSRVVNSCTLRRSK